MKTRIRLSVLAASVVGAVTLNLAPAFAADAADPVAAVDRLMFSDSLSAFVGARAAADRPANLDWSSDGCTGVPDAPFGYDFTTACWRHDFGYRNFKDQGRFTEDARGDIDDVFRKDMHHLCDGRPLCDATAELYSGGGPPLGG
ncbi:phospholipase [Yinghuangia seranimata]|uniref:phospholipase n=1 Tax=Yinghuangia seranimata TaxID=408067 RepID=UPI00248C8C52|nr:phospholipase [Yinghuangia seranimata]MDI2132257.1 phospholipase [Yinghuangia seranimata]